MPKCFCKSNPTSTGFSIEHYEKEFTINFHTVETFKNLTLLKCSNCETLWICENESPNKFCYKIYLQHQLDLLNEWKVNNLSASHLKEIANKIGFASNDYVEVPCKATLTDNTVLDFCILSKWTHHPLISWQSINVTKFIYADKVKKIEPSEYALSLSNRIKLRVSEIYLMRDFIPLILKHDERIYFNEQGGKSFYFDANFLRYKTIKGIDIKEVNQEVEKYKDFSLKDNLSKELTLILFNEW